MDYKCVTDSPEGLVQLLAASYLRHGYWWYVTGRVPKGKCPEAIDQKLVSKYGIAVSPRERSRRKERGLANLHYARHEGWFILVATHGFHPFKQQERTSIRDCRRTPIRFEGYSVSYRQSGLTPKGSGDTKWHAHVRIDKPTYLQLKAFFLDRATHRSAETLAADFARIPYARYAPVRRQLLNVLRAVNKARAKQGYESLAPSVLRLRRKIVPIYRERPSLSAKEAA